MFLVEIRLRNEPFNCSQWKEKLNSFSRGRLPCTRTAPQLAANETRSRPVHWPIRNTETNAPQTGPIAARLTKCGSTFPAFDVPGPSSSVIIAGRSSCWSWPGRGRGPGGMKGARVSEENVDWGAGDWTRAGCTGDIQTRAMDSAWAGMLHSADYNTFTCRKK